MRLAISMDATRIVSCVFSSSSSSSSSSSVVVVVGFAYDFPYHLAR